MALSRQRVRLARRARSQRTIWFCLSDNEPGHGSEVRGEEVLLVQENTTNNQDSQEKEKASS